MGESMHGEDLESRLFRAVATSDASGGKTAIITQQHCDRAMVTFFTRRRSD
jgi:hypothetical protein